MELSQNGISHAQQIPARDNGLTNTACKRKQEHKILSISFTTDPLAPTTNMSNLLHSACDSS